MNRNSVRLAVTVSATILALGAAPHALASKENFDRSKPHVNVAAQQQDTNVEATTETRGARKDARERAREVAQTRQKDDDVAAKTDKSETARAKRKSQAPPPP